MVVDFSSLSKGEYVVLRAKHRSMSFAGTYLGVAKNPVNDENGAMVSLDKNGKLLLWVHIDEVDEIHKLTKENK